MRLDTSVTDIEREDALMARRRRPRPARHTCANCAHDGCCEGLPHCGGTCWAPAFGECDQCGRQVLLEDVEWESEDGKHIFCSEKCMNEWAADNAEEEEADDGE